MAKKIKVRLLDKVNSYRLGDKSFKPGDVFMLPARHFRPDFFEKVVDPPKPELKPEPEEIEDTQPKEKTEQPEEKKEKEAAEDK